MAKFLTNKEYCKLAFTVYYREGKHGPVKPWPFQWKQKQTLKEALMTGAVRRGFT